MQMCSASGCTYFVPVTKEMLGKKIEAVVLGRRDPRMQVDFAKLRLEAWITARYPAILQCKELVLRDGR